MSWFSAPRPQQRWVYALGALATVSAAQLHAQTVHKRVRVDDPNAQVVVRAEEITGRPEREIDLQRDVELIKGQTRMTADTACYNVVEDEVSAKGHIKMWRFGDRYQGDALQLNLSSGQGWVLHPSYRMELNNGQGKANRIDFINQEDAVVSDGTYSTCEGPNPDWYLKSSTLRLDTGRDVGVAGQTVIYFKDVPIIGTPAMSFSLSGARRSGWLPPSIGFGSKGSGEVMVPYYFNIAPNRDLTVYPRMIFARGLQLGATVRYLGETGGGPYLGETHVEGLLHDRLDDGKTRWFISTQNYQSLMPGWTYGWNARAASDNEYPSDFSKSVTNTAERQLLRELRTDYSAQYWSLAARVQNYQVLQDPASATNPLLTVPRPYDRLPQITFHAGQYDIAGFDWMLDIDATRFWHPDRIRGTRALLLPQISYHFVQPGYFITPKVMLNAAKYELVGSGTGADFVPPAVPSLSRAIPTFSLDSGLVFERKSSLFGRAVTQTLEPRLFYVRTPFMDQSQFPDFDTAVAGFSFAQLFTENRFIGQDRISEANQITAAVVSRYIEDNGAERLRLALGQRFYFSPQRVQLDPAAPVEQSRSDVLLTATGRVADDWNFDSAIQYNASTHNMFSSSIGAQWQAGPLKVVNAAYRYQRAAFKNVDMSFQWPLATRWYGVGRLSYSLHDRKVLESLIGGEYKADCWVFRGGAQRFVTAAQTTSTSVFFQLELTGLSRLGFGNPLESFYKSIPGYSRINPESSGRL